MAQLRAFSGSGRTLQSRGCSRRRDTCVRAARDVQQQQVQQQCEKQQQQQQQPGTHHHLGRRAALQASMLGAACALAAAQGAAPPPALAIAAPPAGFKLLIDKIDGYSFMYPEAWTSETSTTPSKEGPSLNISKATGYQAPARANRPS